MSDTHTQRRSLLPYICFGSALTWLLLMGDPTVWGTNLHTHSKAIISFYSLTLIAFGLSVMGFTLYKHEMMKIVKHNKFFWLSGTLLFVSSALCLVYRVGVENSSLIYLASLLAGVGLGVSYCYFICYCELLSFNEIRYLLTHALLVALLLYFIVYGTGLIISNSALLILPVLLAISTHHLKIDKKMQSMSEEVVLKRSAIIASIELFVCLIFVLLFNTQYFSATDQGTFTALSRQLLFVIFVAVLIFEYVLGKYAVIGGWAEKLRYVSYELLIAALVISFISASPSISMYVSVLLINLAAILYLILTAAIFLFQSRQLTQKIRTRLELSFFFLVAVAGGLATPWGHSLIPLTHLTAQATYSELFWALVILFIALDIALKMFGPKDELVYKPLFHQEELDLPQASHNPKAIWIEACRKMNAEFKLTNRESQVIELSVLGYSPNNIAERLDISVYTVRTYTQRARAKLGINSHDMLLDVLEKYL